MVQCSQSKVTKSKAGETMSQSNDDSNVSKINIEEIIFDNNINNIPNKAKVKIW